jgi:bacterioferritin
MTDEVNERLRQLLKEGRNWERKSTNIPGALEYGDIAEQLKKHASQELAHALEVARQIDYLGETQR